MLLIVIMIVLLSMIAVMIVIVLMVIVLRVRTGWCGVLAAVLMAVLFMAFEQGDASHECDAGCQSKKEPQAIVPVKLDFGQKVG